MSAYGRIALGNKPRILVIALRRLGDVLLTTPLIRSVRSAWPHATIDALVFKETAGILFGNPDIDDVIPMPPRPSQAQSLALAARLFRRYELAISTQTGDRPTAFAILAGRKRAAPVEERFSGQIKRALLQRSIPVERGAHRVEEMLRLADALGIPRVAELVNPEPQAVKEMPAGDYAVIHAAPMFRYKQWTAHGWRAVADDLAAHGLKVIATGGPDESERRYLDDVWKGAPVRRLDGRLGWSQVAGLLSGARVYVGPDTSVTHVAAASGCPTVALFGPTDPRLWAPWPKGGLSKPWAAAGRIQRRGNVWLVQYAFPCSPCQLEGCERHLGSHSACLDELSPAQVIEAVRNALERVSVA